VLSEGKELWKAYFQHTDSRAIRDELKLNRPDVGWYQIRKALQSRNTDGDFTPVSFSSFEKAYKKLTEKLQSLPRKKISFTFYFISNGMVKS
jgi:hypothetical protein